MRDYFTFLRKLFADRYLDARMLVTSASSDLGVSWRCFVKGWTEFAIGSLILLFGIGLSAKCLIILLRRMVRWCKLAGNILYQSKVNAIKNWSSSGLNARNLCARPPYNLLLSQPLLNLPNGESSDTHLEIVRAKVTFFRCLWVSICGATSSVYVSK